MYALLVPAGRTGNVQVPLVVTDGEVVSLKWWEFSRHTTTNFMNISVAGKESSSEPQGEGLEKTTSHRVRCSIGGVQFVLRISG